MKVFLNGAERDIDNGTSVLALLQAAGLGERRVAIEINRAIVARSTFAERLLEHGDRIEIVHAIGGG